MNKSKLIKRKDKKGFTLAEVLITLVIIGVVTALTIPSLLANINDKTYDAKRQGFATRMAQAISQIGMLNAFEDSTNPTDNSSMNFIVEGLQKAYSINAVCEIENFKACDFTDMMHNPIGTLISTEPYKKWSDLSNLDSQAMAAALGGVDAKGAAFRTKNGESVLLYYNPKCIAEQSIEPETVIEPEMPAGSKTFAKEICVNMIFDLDGGKKGPNTIGRDIGFMIILYPDVPYVVMTNGLFYGGSGKYSYAEEPVNTSGTEVTAGGYCKKSMNAYGYAVGQWTLASREEIYAASVNYKLLINNQGNNLSWSSTVEGPGADDYGWKVNEANLTAQLEARGVAAGYYTCTVDTSR